MTDNLQEASILHGRTSHVFDVSAAIPPSSWGGILLKGTINPTPTWLELTAWLAHLVPMMTLFLLPARAKAATPATNLARAEQ